MKDVIITLLIHCADLLTYLLTYCRSRSVLISVIITVLFHHIIRDKCRHAASEQCLGQSDIMDGGSDRHTYRHNLATPILVTHKYWSGLPSPSSFSLFCLISFDSAEFEGDKGVRTIDALQIKFLQRLFVVLKLRKCAYSAKQSCAEYGETMFVGAATEVLTTTSVRQRRSSVAKSGHQMRRTSAYLHLAPSPALL